MRGNHCMLKNCEESFCQLEAQLFRIPSDTIGKSKWHEVLDGHECTQSEWLCIKHFNPNDLSNSDGQILLRDGAGPDPNRILTNDFKITNSASNTFNAANSDIIENHEHQSIECKRCDFLQNEVIKLRKQMAEMQKEHNLKLSQEREKFRTILKEKQNLVVQQLNQLAKQVTLDLMDDDYDCSQTNQMDEISTNDVVDDKDANLIIAEIAPSIEAEDPLNIDNVPDDVENTENLSMEVANAFHPNDEILTDGIKCEFNEEDGLQDDPLGELAGEDGSFDENALPDMETTSTNLTLDEIVDPGILIDDIKCETPLPQQQPSSLEWRNALIDRQFDSRKRKRNIVWARNRNKLARQSGLAHVTYRNIPVPAKRPNLFDPLCYDKCRKKCSTKLTMEQREAIFSAYYSLDNTGKNFVLSSCLHRKDVRFHRKNTQKQKLHSFDYSIKVPEQSESIILCKKAICSLFQVSGTRIEMIKRKFFAGEFSDRRGRHSNHKNKKPERVLNEMSTHSDAFKTGNASNHANNVQNGNSKKKKKKNRTSSTFTIKQMYEHYIEQCKSKNLSDEYFVTYQFYANFFYKKAHNTTSV